MNEFVSISPYVGFFLRTYTCPAITSLALSNCNVEELQLLGDFLDRSSPPLSSLRLRLFAIERRDYKRQALCVELLIACLRRCASLTTLIISVSTFPCDWDFGNQIVVALSRRFSGLLVAPKLEYLSLYAFHTATGVLKELIAARWNAIPRSLRSVTLKECTELYEYKPGCTRRHGFTASLDYDYSKTDVWKEVMGYVQDGLVFKCDGTSQV